MSSTLRRSSTLPSRRRQSSQTTENLHDQTDKDSHRRHSASPSKQRRLLEKNLNPDPSNPTGSPTAKQDPQPQRGEHIAVGSLVQQLRRRGSSTSTYAAPATKIEANDINPQSDVDPQTEESESPGELELGRGIEAGLQETFGEDEDFEEGFWRSVQEQQQEQEREQEQEEEQEQESEDFWSRAWGAFDDVCEALMPSLDASPLSRACRVLEGELRSVIRVGESRLGLDGCEIVSPALEGLSLDAPSLNTSPSLDPPSLNISPSSEPCQSLNHQQGEFLSVSDSPFGLGDCELLLSSPDAYSPSSSSLPVEELRGDCVAVDDLLSETDDYELVPPSPNALPPGSSSPIVEDEQEHVHEVNYSSSELDDCGAGPIVQASNFAFVTARMPNEPDPFPFLHGHLRLLSSVLTLPHCSHRGGPEHASPSPLDLQADSLLSDSYKAKEWFLDLGEETYHAFAGMNQAHPRDGTPLTARIGARLLIGNAEERKETLRICRDWGLYAMLEELETIQDTGMDGLRAVLDRVRQREAEQRQQRRRGTEQPYRRRQEAGQQRQTRRQGQLETDAEFREYADVLSERRTRSPSTTPTPEHRQRRRSAAQAIIPLMSGLPSRPPTNLPRACAPTIIPSTGVQSGNTNRTPVAAAWHDYDSGGHRQAHPAVQTKQVAEQGVQDDFDYDEVLEGDFTLDSVLPSPSPSSLASPASPDPLPDVGEIVIDPNAALLKKASELVKLAKNVVPPAFRSGGRGKDFLTRLGQGDGGRVVSVEEDALPDSGASGQDLDAVRVKGAKQDENISPASESPAQGDDVGTDHKDPIDRRSETVKPISPVQLAGHIHKVPADTCPASPSPTSSIRTSSTSSSERCRNLNYNLRGNRGWRPNTSKAPASTGTTGDNAPAQPISAAPSKPLAIVQPSASSPSRTKHLDSTVDRLEIEANKRSADERLRGLKAEAARREQEKSTDRATKENTAANKGAPPTLAKVAADVKEAAASSPSSSSPSSFSSIDREARLRRLPPELQMTVATNSAPSTKSEKKPVNDGTKIDVTDQSRRVSFTDPFDDGGSGERRKAPQPGSVPPGMQTRDTASHSQGLSTFPGGPSERGRRLSQLALSSGGSAASPSNLRLELRPVPRSQRAGLPPSWAAVAAAEGCLEGCDYDEQQEGEEKLRKDSSRKVSDPECASSGEAAEEGGGGNKSLSTERSPAETCPSTDRERQALAATSVSADESQTAAPSSRPSGTSESPSVDCSPSVASTPGPASRKTTQDEGRSLSSRTAEADTSPCAAAAGPAGSIPPSLTATATSPTDMDTSQQQHTQLAQSEQDERTAALERHERRMKQFECERTWEIEIRNESELAP